MMDMCHQCLQPVHVKIARAGNHLCLMTKMIYEKKNYIKKISWIKKGG
jgi:hypothetical protein